MLCPGVGECEFRHLNSFSSLCHSLVGLLGVSPIGLQSQMFWGLNSHVLMLKVGVPNVGYKARAVQGEALGFEFPPNCGLLYQG